MTVAEGVGTPTLTYLKKGQLIDSPDFLQAETVVPPTAVGAYDIYLEIAEGERAWPPTRMP